MKLKVRDSAKWQETPYGVKSISVQVFVEDKPPPQPVIAEMKGEDTETAQRLAVSYNLLQHVLLEDLERDGLLGVLEVKALAEALQAVEFEYWDDYCSTPKCPWCGGYGEHRPDCKRQAALTTFMKEEK